MRTILALLTGWVVAAVLARVGIPHLNPSAEPVPRPLETLGSLAVCLPASLHVSVLHDRASWLSTTAPRPAASLRAAWATVALASSMVLMIVWTRFLPADVPRPHIWALASLVSGAALFSVVLFGPDLAPLVPLIVVGLFSMPGLVPFDTDIVYNVSLTGWLWVTGLSTTFTAFVAFAVRGSFRRH